MLTILLNFSFLFWILLYLQLQDDKLPEIESEVESIKKQIEFSMVPPKPVGLFAAYASKELCVELEMRHGDKNQ